MDSGDDSDDSDADVVEATTTPTYTRKNLKKTKGTGWNYFTSIIDTRSGNVVCYNCIECLPTTVAIDVKRHVRTKSGKSQTGVFSASTASTGVRRHLWSGSSVTWRHEH